MKQKKLTKVIGWILFLFAVGLFCMQMGYFYVHAKYQVEYIDNRLFYIINMFCVICLALAIVLLFKIKKVWKITGASIIIVFIVINGVLLFQDNKQIRNITSISPDFQHVLSIKKNLQSGEAVYYKSYYSILGRPKERLPYKTGDDFKVEWLADDVAAVTYTAASDKSIHQFIGTYGDRGSGTSYYYVGAEIHGQWQGENAKVVSDTEGISVSVNGKTELFDWDHIVQFGTLAVVLMRENEAAWTISLNENFVVSSLASEQTTGGITLYRATMKDSDPVVLSYVSEK